MYIDEAELKNFLLELGIKEFYIEESYDAILHADIFKIFLPKSEAEKFIKGAKNNGRKNNGGQKTTDNNGTR